MDEKVTFTITTSRRLNLFVKTMDSFLNRCKDKDRIVRWICCDDRSNPNDFTLMKNKYPFMEFYKSPKPGQAANLNFLFSKVRTNYILHCEDDWLFIRDGSFITEMLRIAQSDSRIRNIVLRHWRGVYVKNGNLEYRVHVYYEHCGPDHIKRADMKWYGYSLNPGLQHKPTIDALGCYNENLPIVGYQGRFFDRPQALQYYKMGFKRANLMQGYIEHIGDQVSAYNMNKGR